MGAGWQTELVRWLAERPEGTTLREVAQAMGWRGDLRAVRFRVRQLERQGRVQVSQSHPTRVKLREVAS